MAREGRGELDSGSRAASQTSEAAGDSGSQSKRRTAALLITVLIGAAALRLTGVTWGLPGPTHLFSYHPDEYFSLQAGFTLLDGNPNPRFFNYPSLYLYLAGAAALAGGPAGDVSGADQLPALLRDFTLRARLLTVLLSMVTVLVVYGAASRLAGRSAGLWAAAFLAVAPGHVLYSHFAAVDVALALFTALSLYAAIALCDDDRLGTAALAGLATGAAAATKYNGVLALAMPLASLGLDALKKGGKRAAASAAGRALLVIALLAVGFFVFSPYVVLDWEHARGHIAYERDHMRQGEYPAKVADPNGWLFHLRALGYAVGGSVVLALCLAFSAYAVRRCWPRSLPLLAFALIWFVAIGATGVRYARYGLPLLPLLAVGVGIGVTGALGVRKRLLGGLAALAVAVVMLGSLKTAGVLSASMAFEPEPRDEALDAIEHQVPEGATVGLVRTVWFDMPPLDYNNGGDALGSMQAWRSHRRSRYRLRVIPGFDAAALRAERPEWFVETDFQFADWLRARDGSALAFRQALEQEYRLVGTFEREQGWWLFGPCGPAPHDWSYPFAAVRVWALREAEESPGDQGT